MSLEEAKRQIAVTDKYSPFRDMLTAGFKDALAGGEITLEQEKKMYKIYLIDIYLVIYMTQLI